MRRPRLRLDVLVGQQGSVTRQVPAASVRVRHSNLPTIRVFRYSTGRWGYTIWSNGHVLAKGPASGYADRPSLIKGLDRLARAFTLGHRLDETNTSIPLSLRPYPNQQR
jgi:hypothetical protein